MTPQVLLLERNDIASALKVRRFGLLQGSWEPADEEMLIMLQDSPDAILEALVKQDAELAKAEHTDKLPGGRADKRKPSDFDKKQLAAGTKHELEHTDDRTLAQEIAMDHLAEDSDYYVKLRAVEKALPRQEPEDKAKPAKKPILAANKKMGSGGQVRYNYPGEQGGNDSPNRNQEILQKRAEQKAKRTGPQPDEEVNDPHVASPQPPQEPVEVPNPEHDAKREAAKDDPRPPGQAMQQPKHTVNIAELCTALGTSRDVLMQVVQKFVTNPQMGVREGFVKFMTTHARAFAEEHGLDGDYFGLVFDVLTGKVPEGQAMAQQQPQQGATNA